MSKRNLTVVISSLAVICLIGIIAFTNNNKIEESLSVDTNVSVDGQQEQEEKDWVQLEKDNLPYKADGDLHVPVIEAELCEGLSKLEVEDLKEILEVDEETGFTTGITQGNNVVTIIPEEYRNLFDGSNDVDDGEVVLGSNIIQGDSVMQNFNMTYEEAMTIREAVENSTNGSELKWNRE